MAMWQGIAPRCPACGKTKTIVPNNSSSLFSNAILEVEEKLSLHILAEKPIDLHTPVLPLMHITLLDWYQPPPTNITTRMIDADMGNSFASLDTFPAVLLETASA
jgi:hypothetical protein